MTFRPQSIAYAPSQGIIFTNYLIPQPRDPSTEDVGPPYPLYQGWVNTTTKAIWYLEALSASNGVISAQWRAVAPIITSTIAPTSSDYLYPIGQSWVDTAANNYYVLVDVTGTTATWILAAAGTGDLQNIAVQTGTSPVLPLAGTITFNGSTVAAGTNPVRTDGTGANTMALEVQLSQAIAASDATKVGLSNFDSAAFNVDANGFVKTGISRYPITPYVVGPVGSAGYQTIQSAINAANAAGGGAVYIQQGLYVENLTLFDQVNLVGVPAISQGTNQGVTIQGVHTPPSSGHFLANGICFVSTTSVFSSAAAGTAHLVVSNCESAVQSGYLFNIPNWTSTGIIEIYDHNPNTSGAPWAINDGGINNTGGTQVVIYNAGCGQGSNTMTISGVGFFGQAVDIGCPSNLVTGANVTSVGSQYSSTVTLSNNSIFSSYGDSYISGALPAITMSSSGAVSITNATISSSNNPAINGAGAGTFSYGNLTFTNNSSFAGTLTLAPLVTRPYATAGNTGTAIRGTAGFDSNSFSVDSTGFVSLAGGGLAIDQIAVDAFTAPGTNPVLPAATGQITITGAQVATGTIGANVIRTDSLAANSLTVEIQRSTAVAAADSTKNGVAHFKSADFSVDSNGFVSLNGFAGFDWNIINQGTQPANFVINNGYICQAGGTGNVSIALPTTSTLGDVIEIVLDGATTWTITQGAGQSIRFSGSTTTVGVGGSLSTTGTGDAVRLVCETANLKWVALSAIGNLTVT